MSDQIKKFLGEEWRHESWEYWNDVPHCACGEELRDDDYPGRALDEHRVRAALAAAGVAPEPEPEYEYRLVLELHPPMRASWDQAETLWYPTVEEARATDKARGWIAHYRIDYPRARFTERVERRVVAGEPEPVPNQEGEQP